MHLFRYITSPYSRDWFPLTFLQEYTIKLIFSDLFLSKTAPHIPMNLDNSLELFLTK